MSAAYWIALHAIFELYSNGKQSKTILTCMALHNFIRESAMADADFEK